MPLGFPSTPSSGQLATVNNRNYQWNGSAWELVNYTLPVATNNSQGTVQIVPGGGVDIVGSGSIMSVGAQLYLWSNFR